MKHSERFALNQWLSDYPHDKTYAEIMEALNNGGGVWTEIGINPWYAVDVFEPDQVAEFIDDTRRHVEDMMDDLAFGICLSDKTEDQSRAEGIIE
jgi:hypothetical protein